MPPHMGEMMWFLRTNSLHHSMAIARGPHVVAAPRLASRCAASTSTCAAPAGCCATGSRRSGDRAGTWRATTPSRYFLDPHGNTIEYTTELEMLDEDTWHPHLYDFSDPEVTDQWGTANAMNEFVAAKSFNDPDRGVLRRAAGLMRLATSMTLATYAVSPARGSDWSTDGDLYPLPSTPSVLSMIGIGAGSSRARRPAAQARADRLRPGRDVRLLAPLLRPACATSWRSRSTSRACAAASTAAAGVPEPGTTRRRSTSPTRTPSRPRRRDPVPGGLQRPGISSSRSPWSSAAPAGR